MNSHFLHFPPPAECRNHVPEQIGRGKSEPHKTAWMEEEKEIALKQKAEEEQRIRDENKRIKEWEDKFDQEQKKKEEELIKKFYSNEDDNKFKVNENENPSETKSAKED